jgi:hypothetical protein
VHALVFAIDVFTVHSVPVDNGEIVVSGASFLIKYRHITDRPLECWELVDFFTPRFTRTASDTQRGVVQKAGSIVRNSKVGMLDVVSGIQGSGNQSARSKPSQESPS